MAYSKIINEETKLVVVGTGTDNAYYESIGMTQMDVEQAYDSAWYVKGYAPSKPKPTTAEQVQALEDATGLTRAVRELVLANNSGASDYVKSKANEIEDLAKQLRTTEETSVTGKENLQVEETEKVN